MFSLPRVIATSRTAAIATMLVGVSACAPIASQPPSLATNLQGTPSASTPVLLSCPAGQQPLMRQVLVNGAPVPQVECVSATPVAPIPSPAYAPGVMPAPAVAAPAFTSAAYPTYEPVAMPVSTRTTGSPRARRAVYEGDVVEYRRPARRTWQKSAVVIGSAAGIGAGVGAVTKGKKGALIGAAIGGGAATVWDQITRRQPR